MKLKNFVVHIWFLDADLQKSASFLTNKTLLKSIDGCIGVLISTYLYFIGIRSKKFYDYYFAKERIDETINRFFPNWPLSKKPAFSSYSYKESKWCRQCHENYDYVLSYLRELLLEYEYRNGHQHLNTRIIDWFDLDMPKFDFPYANVDVILPWKSLDLKYRRQNIIDGYRLKFMSTFEEDVFKEYDKCPRDIPDFVIKYFNLNTIALNS